MSLKIIVVGSVNTDLVIKAPRVPDAGETIKGSQFEIIPGGKGANQAVAASRQGGQVSLIGCVGDDDFGKQQIQTLQSDRIQLENLSIINDQSTGIAVILLEDSGENRIILEPGANNFLSAERIQSAKESIISADILIAQLETPLDSVTEAISIAHQYGIPVILNPAPASTLNADLLSMVDYLVPNETEATLLTGIEVTNIETAKRAINKLLEIGVKNVIITLGDQGVIFKESGEFHHSQAIQVDTLDTTAAGDTFIGCLAQQLCEGKSLKKAVDRARFAAAITVTRLGAQTSIPTSQETEIFVQQVSKGAR